MNWNKIQLAGNAGKDAELKYSTTGIAISKFTLAVTENTKENKTTWFDIVCFAKNAEFAEQYIKKGTKVFLEGKLSIEEYEKDGRKQKYTSIIANNFQLLSKVEKKVAFELEKDEDNDLPF